MNKDVLLRAGWKRSKEYRGLWQHPDYPGSRFILQVAYEQEFRRLAFRAGNRREMELMSGSKKVTP